MCQSMVNIQSPTAEIRRGKKRKKKKKKQDENIMVCPITQGDYNRDIIFSYRLIHILVTPQLSVQTHVVRVDQKVTELQRICHVWHHLVIKDSQDFVIETTWQLQFTKQCKVQCYCDYFQLLFQWSLFCSYCKLCWDPQKSNKTNSPTPACLHRRYWHE